MDRAAELRVGRAMPCAAWPLLAWMLGACSAVPADLSEAQLSAVVMRERPGLERCYHTALEKNPYVRDITMEAIIVVAPSGGVKSVELEGGGGLPGMSPCLLATIKSWRFPTAKDETATSLPIVFRPEVKEQADPAAVQEAVKQALDATGAKPQ